MYVQFQTSSHTWFSIKFETILIMCRREMSNFSIYFSLIKFSLFHHFACSPFSSFTSISHKHTLSHTHWKHSECKVKERKRIALISQLYCLNDHICYTIGFCYCYTWCSCRSIIYVRMTKCIATHAPAFLQFRFVNFIDVVFAWSGRLKESLRLRPTSQRRFTRHCFSWDAK